MTFFNINKYNTNDRLDIHTLCTLPQKYSANNTYINLQPHICKTQKITETAIVSKYQNHKINNAKESLTPYTTIKLNPQYG